MDRFGEIEALVAVVETGSFTAAARRLDSNKSAISRRVGQLESRLGSRLLNRTTRRLSLTESGERFYQQVTGVLADLDEAEQSVSDAEAELRGRIRLAAPLSFGLLHLGAVLPEFLERHPGIELDLDLNDREVNLVEEGFDMALRIGELADSSLIAKRVGWARSLACASPTYLRLHGKPTHPDHLREHFGLQYSNISYRQQWSFVQGKQLFQGQPQIRLRANNGEVLATAAVAGLGIVSGPTFILHQHLRAGELLPVLPGFERPGVGIYTLFPPGRMIPRRMQALSTFLDERFGRRPYWDEGLDQTL